MYDKTAIEEYSTPSGLKRYRLPVVNTQLNKHRFVSSDAPEFAIHKATLQEMLWAEQWQERAALKHKKLGLEMNGKRADLKVRQKLKIAEERTNIAQRELAAAYNVLRHGLETPVDFDWEFFTRCPEYPVPMPARPEYPAAPEKPTLPREPRPTDTIYQPKLESIDKLRPARRLQKEEEAKKYYESAHRQWEQLCLQLRGLYQQQWMRYKSAIDGMNAGYQKKVQAWEQGKAEYLRAREACIKWVDHKKAAFLEHEPNAVLDYFDMALSCSRFPAFFPHSFEMDYFVANRTLVIDYLIPPLRLMPRLARVVYHEEDNLFHEIILSEGERNMLYARLLHELPLRIFHEIFNVDSAVSLAAIRLRGYIFLEESRDSGKPPTKIVEIRTDRATFAATDLYHGDPAVIFEEMGGIIHSLE